MILLFIFHKTNYQIHHHIHHQIHLILNLHNRIYYFSIFYYIQFSAINTMFVPCTALLYDSTAATRILKLSATLLSISCGIRLISFLMMLPLVCGLFSQTLSFRYPLRRLSGGLRSWEQDGQGLLVLRDMSLSHETLCLRYSSVLFKKRGGALFLEQNRKLEYLRHNFPWDRLILRHVDNPWPSYSQDLNPPDYFLRGYLKDRIYEDNPQTREDIIRREIRRIPQEMLNRVVDNFNVLVAAVLSYSSVVYGTNIVLITEKVQYKIIDSRVVSPKRIL